MRWTPFLLAPAAIVTLTPAHATVYLSVEQAQQAMFPGRSFSKAPVQLSAAQRDAMYERSGVHLAFNADNVWRVSGGGFFILDQVVGKHEFITYAVALNAGGTVKQIEILEYRESYGFEVREASWRSQFVGKSSASPLQLNQDIKNISGATLSSKHITDGVKRVLAFYDVALKAAQ
jgi:hypothetical protein